MFRTRIATDAPVAHNQTGVAGGSTSADMTVPANPDTLSRTNFCQVFRMTSGMEYFHKFSAAAVVVAMSGSS
jgi:hypothetical protein